MGDVQKASDRATGAKGRQATHLAPLFIPPSDEQPLRAPGDRLTYDDLPHTPPPSMPKHKAGSVRVLMELSPRVSAEPKSKNAYRQEMQSDTFTTLKICLELIHHCIPLHWRLSFFIVSAFNLGRHFCGASRQLLQVINIYRFSIICNFSSFRGSACKFSLQTGILYCK